MDRLNTFMDDYPNKTEVEILWPSFKQQGTTIKKTIYPIRSEYNGRHYVEFNFVATKK